MKFNYRDKIIAGILLAIIILLVGFCVPVKNMAKKNKTDKATLAQRQATKEEYETKINAIPGIQESIRSTYNEAKDITKLFVPMDDVKNQVMLDKYLQKYADDCKVRILSLDLGASTVSPIDYYHGSIEDKFGAVRAEADINGTLQSDFYSSISDDLALSQRAKEQVVSTQYGLNIEGTKKNVWKYLEAIKKMDNSVIIDSVNFADFTFGKETAKQKGVEMPDSEEEISVQAGNDTIKNTSTAQIVISLYSVIEMEEPDVQLK